MSATSGTAPFQFSHRADLPAFPPEAADREIHLHGTAAADHATHQLYYSIPEYGLVRLGPGLQPEVHITLPPELAPHNIHSTKLATIDGASRLALTANEAELVGVVTLDGALDFTLGRPPMPPYDDPATPYKPTDMLVTGDRLYIADGYGANVIIHYDLAAQAWGGTFGGKNTDEAVAGQFGTAHGITLTPDGGNLMIADRWHSRFQVHQPDGTFVRSYGLPAGAWPCGIDFVMWEGRPVGLVANLYGPDRDQPAPIYILDGASFEVLSTVRPKAELGLEAADRMHNAVWHIHEGRLYMVCQSWNPGSFFVLEQVAAE